MKKKKGIISLIIVFCVCLSFVCPAKADDPSASLEKETEEESSEAEETENESDEISLESLSEALSKISESLSGSSDDSETGKNSSSKEEKQSETKSSEKKKSDKEDEKELKKEIKEEMKEEEEEETEPFEWDEDNREMAWFVYGATEWVETANGTGFVFDYENGGSLASTSVPDGWKSQEVNSTGLTNVELVEKVLSNESNGLQSDMEPLLLSIIYELHWRGVKNVSSSDHVTADYFYYCPLITDKEKMWNSSSDAWSLQYLNMTEEDFVFRLASLLQSCLGVYNSNHKDDTASLYRNDDKLQVVVQGVLYGTNFCKDTDTYSANAAKQYAKKHADLVPEKAASWKTFASDVTALYSALEALGVHTVIG